MRAWAVPLVLGLLTFSGVLGLVRLAPPPEAPALIPPFTAPVVDPRAPGRLLAVRPSPSGAALVEVQVEGPGPVVVDGEAVAGARPAPPGPRFGSGGLNGSVLAFHAFTADGRLLASSAGPGELGRFRLHGDFRHLGPVALYLGTGQPSNGTVALPRSLAPLGPALRAALAGQPEGGVAVVRIEEGRLAELYGTVAVGVQVVRLVRAP